MLQPVPWNSLDDEFRPEFTKEGVACRVVKFQAYIKNIPLDWPYARPSSGTNPSIDVPFYVFNSQSLPLPDIGQPGSVHFGFDETKKPALWYCVSVDNGSVWECKAWEFPDVTKWHCLTWGECKTLLFPYPGLIDRYFWIINEKMSYTSLAVSFSHSRDFRLEANFSF